MAKTRPECVTAEDITLTIHGRTGKVHIAVPGAHLDALFDPNGNIGDVLRPENYQSVCEDWYATYLTRLLDPQVFESRPLTVCRAGDPADMTDA